MVRVLNSKLFMPNILNGLSGYSNDYNFNISTFINEQIAIDTYLDDVENGDRAIDIQNPTQPENLNFSQYENISILKIAVFLILGSIIGVFIFQYQMISISLNSIIAS